MLKSRVVGEGLRRPIAGVRVAAVVTMLCRTCFLAIFDMLCVILMCIYG